MAHVESIESVHKFARSEALPDAGGARHCMLLEPTSTKKRYTLIMTFHIANAILLDVVVNLCFCYCAGLYDLTFYVYP